MLQESIRYKEGRERESERDVEQYERAEGSQYARNHIHSKGCVRAKEESQNLHFICTCFYGAWLDGMALHRQIHNEISEQHYILSGTPFHISAFCGKSTNS